MTTAVTVGRVSYQPQPAAAVVDAFADPVPEAPPCPVCGASTEYHHPSDHAAEAAAEVDDPLRQIGRAMRAIDRERAGLVEAVRHARARGFSWARIGVILGVSRQAAQQRFGEVDEELRSQGKTVPVDEDVQPPVNLALIELAEVPGAAAPAFDFSAITAMTVDEIIAMAGQQLPIGVKLYDRYLRALREAIVVTLYKRDVSQPKIAKVIGTSNQRVSQILGRFYDRAEQQWKEERAQWGKGGAP